MSPIISIFMILAIDLAYGKAIRELADPNANTQIQSTNDPNPLEVINQISKQHPELKVSGFDVRIDMHYGDQKGKCGCSKCKAPSSPVPQPKAEEQISAPPTPPPPTTTTGRPTCAAERVIAGRYDLCASNSKIKPGKTATRECETQCYSQDKGHYRGASCNPANNGIECKCFYDPCRNSEMDVVFLLDSSGSLDFDQFNQEKGFIKNFISRMTLGAHKSRAALVRFSDFATVIFDFLNIAQSQKTIAGKLSTVDHEQGGTNITGALQVAGEVLEKTKRPHIPQVVVLVTDGEHNVGSLTPTVPASDLRKKGILVYALGIGQGVVKQNLVDITGDEDHVFLAQFSALSNVIDVIGAEVTATVNN